MLAVVALLLPRGWIFAGAIVALWLWLIQRSRIHKAQRASALDAKTEFERNHHLEAARSFKAEVVEPANQGDLSALQKLLDRWQGELPFAARPFSARLERAPGGGCRITGQAIGPDGFPAAIPRLARGRRVVLDKRLVSDVDDDLTEVNAACAFSLLLALFGDADRAFVHMRLDIATAPGSEIPWIRVFSRVGYTELQNELSALWTPSEAIRALGGTVGRRQLKRFYPAEEPAVTKLDDPIAQSTQPMPEPAAESATRTRTPARAAFTAVELGDSTSAGSSERVSPRAGRSSWTKATPQRKDGIGPDPAALLAGQMNPEREGKVFDAIRGGEAGSTVASLMAATGLREPTVRYFGISADEAGLVEALQIGGVYHFIIRVNDNKATEKAFELRRGVLKLRDSARRPANTTSEKKLTSLKQWQPLGTTTFARVEPVSAPAFPTPVQVTEQIPAPPPDRLRVAVAGEPSPTEMRGSFGVVAKRWGSYEGNPDARFAPFNHYYPTYENLDAAQLCCYFGWRTAFRAGNTPPTDLSYLFIHVYELLHVIGVPDLRKAGSELERLWRWYRGTYSKLDNYLIPWIADLYATESLNEEVSAWYRRAAEAGATIPDPQLVTDFYWAPSDYPAMPRIALATLTGDPKLGTNKFCQEHNGDGWVEHGYREALAIADSAFKAKRGKSVREATIETGGLQPLTRKPFNGAVYDWRRNPVTLAVLPDLGDDSLAVQTFRAASRYAENLLREQRKFKSRLRGIELEPEIAAAIDRRLSAFIKATRARTRVTIDLEKAKELEKESADVRSILLAGAESNGTEPNPSVTVPRVPDNTPEGLLTDFAAIASAIGACSMEARSVLEAFLAAEWELAAEDSRLAKAAGSALVSPLIEEINGHVITSVRDTLIVAEGERYVVQEDLRDEVYCVLRGSLEGFGHVIEKPSEREDAFGFGPTDLDALRFLVDGGDVEARLDSLGAVTGSSGLLLIDHLNELALASPHGDVIVDAGQSPPSLIDDGREWVVALVDRLSHIPAISSSPIAQ